MKRTILVICVVICVLNIGAALGSEDADMVTDRTKQKIEVDTRFAGERIYFFGTIPDPEADIIVKLISKHNDPIKLTRKGKVVLFWMSTKQFELRNVPYIYKIHSSKPLGEFLTPELVKEYKLDYETLKDDMEIRLIKGEPSPDDKEVMFEGYLKMKEDENLYRIAENRIRITKGRLFEHYFTFPDKAKEGDYVIESYAIKDGQVIAESNDIVEVKKVGLMGWLYRTSQNNGILYGIMAVVIALGAGLLVGRIFKGGGH
jgi:uncharacterized protein (TIGR02186 family)